MTGASSGPGSCPTGQAPAGLDASRCDPSRADYDDYYDDYEGMQEDAEWCDRCQGMGIANCYCGGDQCYCENYGEMECPRCHGEGYFVPTAEYKAAREEHARWWQELHQSLDATTPSPTPTTETDNGE